MKSKNIAITKTDNFPIRYEGKVHNGKVRSVYWLNKKDSRRIGEEFFECESPRLGVMVISDRISAFECMWESENLKGVPKKGASLNAISGYWFDRFEEEDLAGNHILAKPHPLVWIVQRAKPVMVEAIARKYITGSMWRAYEKGEREFCGNKLPNELQKNQELEKLLITPTTKGILKSVLGIPEQDDVDITRQQIRENYETFGFEFVEDIRLYESLLKEGFDLISEELNFIGRRFVDTKFEFGYLTNSKGRRFLGYIDEIGTPDSSRYWDSKLFRQGEVVEESKELFRKILLNGVADKDVLLNKNRMSERIELAKSYRVCDEDMIAVSGLYQNLAQQITGKKIPTIENPREEIVESLVHYGIIE